MAGRTRVIEIDEDAFTLAQRAATLEHTDIRAFVQGLIASRADYIRNLAFCDTAAPYPGPRAPQGTSGCRSSPVGRAAT